MWFWQKSVHPNLDKLKKTHQWLHAQNHHQKYSFNHTNVIKELEELRNLFGQAGYKIPQEGPIYLESHGQHPFHPGEHNNLNINGSELNYAPDALHFLSLRIENVTAHGSYSDINAIAADLRHGRGLDIVNCCIGNLTIVCGRIRIEQCEIGNLTIIGRPDRLEIKNSSVGNVIVQNDLRADCKFTSLHLAHSKKESEYYSSVQPLRNLLAILKETHNFTSAHFVRADVLRAEYPEEKGVLKLVSWFYGATCDYGRFPGRAFWWLFGLITLTTLIGYYGGGAFVNVDSDGDGFVAAFGSRFLSSLGYSVQLLVNPFSILSAKMLFLPKTSLQIVAGLFQAVTSVGLYAVIALSIRRRFRFS